MMADVYDFDRARRAASQEAKDEQDPFGYLSYDDLWLDKRTEENWICKDLELGPGRPCGLWGYGSTGKSYFALLIVLCVATGRLLLDRFEVRKGRSVYLSHEMGKHTCVERIRRLANGLCCEPREFAIAGAHDPNPKIGIYPTVKLNDPNASDAYCKEFENTDLVTIDSLRRAMPGEDENDSTAAKYLDLLAVASEKTGCTFNVLHHTGKDDPRSTAEGKKTDKRTSGRGSSAFFDGSGSVWHMEGQGKSPRRLSQIRAHDDGDGASEKLLIELVQLSMPEPIFHTRRGPVKFQLVGAPPKAEVDPFDRIKAEVLMVVKAMPGVSSRAVEERVKVRATSVRQALSELEAAGKVIVRDGPRNAKLYYPAP